MPQGDGTGSAAGCNGRGGKMKSDRAGRGPVGTCICPVCGTKAPHRRGEPCYEQTCSKCGAKMVRE